MCGESETEKNAGTIITSAVAPLEVEAEELLARRFNPRNGRIACGLRLDDVDLDAGRAGEAERMRIDAHDSGRVMKLYSGAC